MKTKIIKIKSLLLILALTLMMIPIGTKITKAEALDTDIVTFKDANLEAVVREKLSKQTGDITVGDMRGMTGKLDGGERNISDLTGLEHAINLTELSLSKNKITDISQLSGMTKLTYLSLGDNQISNIDAIKNMTELIELRLYGNKITDICPLEKLVKLTYLRLQENQISNIDALKGLNSLSRLDLDNNQISNIDTLKDMTSLKCLYLDKNKISNIDALKDMTSLTELYLYDNQISNIDALKDMTSLEYLDLANNEISNIDALKDMTSLEYLDLANNEISNIDALKDMTSLIVLLLNNNQISDIDQFSNLKGLQMLALSNNRITEIPSSISELSSLTFLDMRNNNLSGELPESLNNLNNLKYEYPYNDYYDEERNIYTSFAGNYLTGTVPTALKTKLGEAAFYNNLLEGETNQKQLTLIDGAELNLSLNSVVTSKALKSITNLFDGESSHSKSLYELELVPVEEDFFDANGKAIKSGKTTAYVKIKGISDSNTYARTLTPVTINILDNVGSNGDVNLDLSINNSLEIILGDDEIDFGDSTAVLEKIKPMTLIVISSLPYDISTKANSDFIGEVNSQNLIPINHLSLDIDNMGYLNLEKEMKLNLGDNTHTLQRIHGLKFKLVNTAGYKIDNYKTEIELIVEAN